jgi:hypothetical protein
VHANDDGGSTVKNYRNVCVNCREAPAAGAKLRVCGRCLSSQYCSDVCQRDDWADHRNICQTCCTAREQANVVYEHCAPGSAKQSLKRDTETV